MDCKLVILAKAKVSKGFLENNFNELKEGLIELFNLIEKSGKELDKNFIFKPIKRDDNSVALVLLELDSGLGELAENPSTEIVQKILSLLKSLGKLFLINIEEEIANSKKENENTDNSETEKLEESKNENIIEKVEEKVETKELVEKPSTESNKKDEPKSHQKPQKTKGNRKKKSRK